MLLAALVRRYDQIPWLHQIREIIRRWWGIDIIYIDKSDTPVFLAGQPAALRNQVCAVALGQHASRGLCLDCIRQVRRETESTSSGGAQLSLGCHLGMVRMGVPIRIEGRDGGMIYTSGFFDRERSTVQAAALEPVEERAAPELQESVPVLTPLQVGRLADLLELGVAAIVTLFAELRAKEDEIAALRERLQERKGLHGLVGSSSAMQEVYRLVERVAENDCTVLVRGESGTGKELVASAVHELSQRASGPFVVQNCSAFNDSLLESELFGHVRGAFTGAISDKKGFFEIAGGGTLFLDEVAEMSAALQVKLLRVLQDHTFWPVGASAPRSSDVRIVAATHRDLEAMVKEGSFREDLYYRLNVITILLPPLRERRSDIPVLAAHFLGQRGGASLSAEALRAFCDYDWPGNVRELANEIERLTVLSGGARQLGRELLSSRIQQSTAGKPGEAPPGGLRQAREALELRMIRAALEQCDGNRSRAARQLGIARSNLLVKMKEFGIP